MTVCQELMLQSISLAVFLQVLSSFTSVSLALNALTRVLVVFRDRVGDAATSILDNVASTLHYFLLVINAFAGKAFLFL